MAVMLILTFSDSLLIEIFLSAEISSSIFNLVSPNLSPNLPSVFSTLFALGLLKTIVKNPVNSYSGS